MYTTGSPEPMTSALTLCRHIKYAACTVNRWRLRVGAVGKEVASGSLASPCVDTSGGAELTTTNVKQQPEAIEKNCPKAAPAI
eukprot:10912786-Alexandrium_andersonii.AAC.1